MAQSGKTTETIGGVKLDYRFYPGEDYYCDGTVEDELLTIAKETDPSDYEAVIRREKSWPVLYHLSAARGNIVDWIPFTGREKVLEIGSGCGAVTGTLAAKCREVTCVELSRKRSLINAWRHKDCSNIRILVGNFEDIEPSLEDDYDYVFLIGVFEYAASYLHEAEDPFRAELTRIRAHVRPETGRIVIAIENRLGLKYFAGCREDHSGVYFDGIENYRNGPHPATTFTRPALEAMFRDTGLSAYSFYYPYPDYKFMETLYSDRRLPDGAELSDNIRNFDRERLLLFDEKKAYTGITADGLFPVFSNSYEIVLGPALPVTYCKFSSDRVSAYRIRTALYELPVPDQAGQTEGTAAAVEEPGSAGGASGAQPIRREIRKYPLGSAAAGHVQQLPVLYRALEERFRGKLAIAPCHLAADGSAVFDYIPGRTMESLLDERLDAGDREDFCALVQEYRDLVSWHEEEPIADPDMTFANLVGEEGHWTAIDYEWAEKKPLSGRELTCRSLLVFFREDPARREKAERLVGRQELLRMTGLDEAAAEAVQRREEAFQESVTGGAGSLGNFRASMHAAVLRPVELQTEEEKAAGRRAAHEEELRQQREAYERSKALTGVKVYYDTGKGYNENQTLEIPQLYGRESVNSFTVPVAADVKRLRIDPASVPCLVLLREIRLGDSRDSEKVFRKLRRHNGNSCAGGAVLYTGSDPWMEWDMEKVRRKCGISHRQAAQPDQVFVSLQMTGIPGTMAELVEEQARGNSHPAG